MSSSANAADASVPPPKRRRWLKRLGLLFALFVAYVGFIAARLFLFQPELEVGKETTFVEGPLRPDGTIDYVAALNDEWSQGVTPENNAAVPLMEAFGPSVVNSAIREEFFERLGIEPLPEEGNYLVPIDVFLEVRGVEPERREKLFSALGEVHGSEMESDYPEFAAWVERNQAPLQQIVDASGRERFNTPVLPIPPGTTLVDVDLAMIQRCREAARLLNTAAILSLQRGDVAAACEYAIAGHRLGRHVAGHPTMIGYLVGAAIESISVANSEEIVLSGRLSPELAKQFRHDIESLPPPMEVSDVVDRGERLVSLDSVANIASKTGGPAMPSLIPGRLAGGFDRNVMLREFNDLFDRAVEAMNEHDRNRESGEALKKFTVIQKASAQVGPAQIAWVLVTGSRTAISRHVSSVLASLLAPALEQVQVAEDRTVMKSHLLHVTAALAEYRAVEGGYPETLDALRPKYLDELPADFYAGAPLKYRRVGEAFLLYSVGENRKDDGGLTYGEGESNDCDDLRFGVAPKEATDAN